MSNEFELRPIGGLSGRRLTAIAQHLKLDCKGPRRQELLGKLYLGWACSGAISPDDPGSLVTLDFMGIEEERILSVSGQIHSSTNTEDFTGHGRKILGYILAALDPSVADAAIGWLDQALNNQDVGKLEVEGVVFDFILHQERALAFDIHSDRF